MLKFATYNILHGYHSDLILKNLDSLIKKGADVICMQEADLPFQKELDNLLRAKEWKVVYYNNTLACNLAIAWNPSVLTLQDKENIPLPKLEKITLKQLIVDSTQDIQRGALRANFLIDGKVIEITNAHLAWEGGIKHTLLQLTHLKKKLRKQKSKYKILAGDFNTFALKIFKRAKERKIEKVLEDWSPLPNISWTWDTLYTAPQDGITPYANFLNSIGIKMRSKLDHVFFRNLKIKSSETIDLPGSDHRPIFVEIEFKD